MSEANLHEMLTFTHHQFANRWIDVRVGAKLICSLKMIIAKKPRLAENGLGCGLSKIKWCE